MMFRRQIKNIVTLENLHLSRPVLQDLGWESVEAVSNIGGRAGLLFAVKKRGWFYALQKSVPGFIEKERHFGPLSPNLS